MPGVTSAASTIPLDTLFDELLNLIELPVTSSREDRGILSNVSLFLGSSKRKQNIADSLEGDERRVLPLIEALFHCLSATTFPLKLYKNEIDSKLEILKYLFNLPCRSPAVKRQVVRGLGMCLAEAVAKKQANSLFLQQAKALYGDWVKAVKSAQVPPLPPKQSPSLLQRASSRIFGKPKEGAAQGEKPVADKDLLLKLLHPLTSALLAKVNAYQEKRVRLGFFFGPSKGERLELALNKAKSSVLFHWPADEPIPASSETDSEVVKKFKHDFLRQKHYIQYGEPPVSIFDVLNEHRLLPFSALTTGALEFSDEKWGVDRGLLLQSCR